MQNLICQIKKKKKKNIHNQDQCKVKKEKKLLIIEVNFVNAYAFKQGKHIN